MNKALLQQILALIPKISDVTSRKINLFIRMEILHTWNKDYMKAQRRDGDMHNVLELCAVLYRRSDDNTFLNLVFINFAMVSGTRSWLANAIYFMTQSDHETFATVAQCGLMESCYQIGRFVLAVPSGLLADKYGRKQIIIAVGCIQVVTWATLSITHCINVILVVRFFQGCAAALSNTTGPNAIGEICSPKYRGFFIALYKSTGTLGIIVECVFASIFCSYSTTVFATTALTLLFFPTIPWIIESPYYLLGVSKYEEAKRTLTKIRQGQSESEISSEYEQLKQSIEHEESIKSERNWLQYLALKSTRKPLICCILLNTLVFANGTNVIFLYASVIFPPNDYVSNKMYPLVLSLIQLGSSMSAAFLIDALPRRQFYMLSGFLSFMIQSFNGIMYYEYMYAEDEERRDFSKWSFLVGSVLFWILANAVISPLHITLKSEILPLSIRGLGNSICIISQSISTIICYQIFSRVDAYLGTPANYAIFALNSLLIIAVVHFLVPETRGKTLAEVQQKNHTEDSVKIARKKSECNNNNNNHVVSRSRA